MFQLNERHYVLICILLFIAVVMLIRSAYPAESENPFDAIPDPDVYMAQHPEIKAVMPSDTTKWPFPAQSPLSVPLTMALLYFVKMGLGRKADLEIVQRLMPFMPILVTFGLTFIPGSGFAAAPAVMRIIYAVIGGALAGWGHKAIKQGVQGQV